MSEFLAIVVLNGEAPRGFAAAALWTLSQRTPRPLIIAADGGAGILLAQGIYPDIFIGDGDSLNLRQQQQLKDHQIEMIILPCEKDLGDGQAAVELAMERTDGRIAIFGAFGGRLDFTLANVMLPLIFGHQQSLRACFFGANHVARYAANQDVLRGHDGETVSLLAISPQVNGITLQGFAYPLDNYTLTTGSSRGISNIIRQEDCQITHTDGDLLIIHTRKEQ